MSVGKAARPRWVASFLFQIAIAAGRSLWIGITAAGNHDGIIRISHFGATGSIVQVAQGKRPKVT
jgi:hypothetical protein